MFLRAAVGNGWSLSQLMGAYFGNNFFGDSIALLDAEPSAARFAKSIGLGKKEYILVADARATRLKGAGYLWNDLKVPLNALRRDRVAVCPACLNADKTPYLRSRWEHRFSNTCPIHECALVDHCPTCTAPLNMLKRTALCVCKCGHDIRTSSTVPSRTRDASLLNKAIADKDSDLLAEALAIMEVLSSFFFGQSKTLPNHELSDLAVSVLEDPAKFIELLPNHGPHRLSPRVLLIDPLSSLAGRTVNLILSACSETCHHFIRGDWKALLNRGISRLSAQKILGINSHGLQDRKSVV